MIDSNLLCLLVVGSTSRDLITSHKRTRTFDADAYDLLVNIVNSYGDVKICPHVLAQTSDLVCFGAHPVLREMLLSKLAEITAQSIHSVPLAKTPFARPEYFRLGLTDAVLLCLAKSKGMLLTADLDLYLAATKANYEVTNFNHVLETVGLV